MVTAGADGAVSVLDPRRGLAARSTTRLTDFPYALAAAGGLAFVGCGDGSVHVIDLGAGVTLYALGAGRAAVRTIDVVAGRWLVCGGDDGAAVSYDFGAAAA